MLCCRKILLLSFLRKEKCHWKFRSWCVNNVSYFQKHRSNLKLQRCQYWTISARIQGWKISWVMLYLQNQRTLWEMKFIVLNIKRVTFAGTLFFSYVPVLVEPVLRVICWIVQLCFRLRDLMRWNLLTFSRQHLCSSVV